MARNIQKIHAAVLGASYKREGEFVYQWLLYMDVNLVLPLAISFFNSRVEAAF